MGMAKDATAPGGTEIGPVENALARMRMAQPGMAKGARRIADYIIAQP